MNTAYNWSVFTEWKWQVPVELTIVEDGSTLHWHHDIQMALLGWQDDCLLVTEGLRYST
jgi:hypothetical protein